MLSSRVAVFAACAAIGLVPASAILDLWRHRHQAEIALQREGMLKCVAMAAHANQVLISADQTLDGLERQVRAGDRLDEATLRRRVGGLAGHQALAERLDQAGIVHDIYAFDADGRLLAAGSRFPAPYLDVHDRPVFLFHARHPLDPNTFVGTPLPDEVASTPALLMSRAVSRPDGQFLGVLMVAVSTAYFRTFYDDLARYSAPNASSQSALALALVRDDGVIAARSTGPGAQRGARVARTGPYRRLPALLSPGWRTPLPSDYAELTPWAARNADNQVAIRHLSGYPLSVLVAIDPGVFQAVWRRQCLEIAELSVFSLLLLAAAFTWLIRSLRAREREHEELRLLRDAAESANRAKGEFLSTMSHEIRTPLNGIVGTAELMTLGPLNPEQRRFADTLLRSARGLLALIGEVLDFAKIESGSIQVDRTPFDAEALVREVAALFTATASAKGLLLDVDVEADLPPVLGDPLHVRQVLTNLVSNAVKFTDAGRVSMRVVAHSRAGSGPCLRFSVSDTGIGITSEVREKLFVPFEQGDSSVSRRFGGTGLGLAISARLAQAMGGRLEVDSRVGEGTTFHFELPCEEAPAGLLAAEPAATPPRASAQETPVAPARILLVEDDETNCLVIAAQIALLGHHCSVAPDGIEALAKRAQSRPDLVLMDCNLPRLSGYDTARQWRALEREEAVPPVPIIALSANIMADNLEACRAAGMDDFISKPCGLERLRMALQRWLTTA